MLIRPGPEKRPSPYVNNEGLGASRIHRQKPANTRVAGRRQSTILEAPRRRIEHTPIVWISTDFEAISSADLRPIRTSRGHHLPQQKTVDSRNEFSPQEVKSTASESHARITASDLRLAIPLDSSARTWLCTSISLSVRQSRKSVPTWSPTSLSSERKGTSDLSFLRDNESF